MSFVSSKGNILCRLIKIELYKIFAIINRAIKSAGCTKIIQSNTVETLLKGLHCITLDNFSASGTLPLLKVMFMICVIGFVIESLHSFMCFGCIWSSPQAFLFCNCIIILSISCLLVGVRKKSV